MVKAFIHNKQGVSLKSNRVLKNIYETENIQMEKYLSNYDEKEKCFKVKYNLPKHGWGRISPVGALSLCLFHRPTRHAYCESVYIDIDMKNAHPVIVSNLCRLNNITDISNINSYCENRDAFLANIQQHYNVSKSDAKTLILRLTYGGKYDSWHTETELKTQTFHDKLPDILLYEEEMSRVRNIVYEKNTHIIADVEKADPTYFKNPKYKTAEDILNKKKKTCMSLYCCTIERHIQEMCISYLIEKKGLNTNNDVVPCQDGFMIRPLFYYEGLLEDLKIIVMEKMGFTVDFNVKEFDEACIIKPIEQEIYVAKLSQTPSPEKGVYTDLEAAQVVFGLYKHWVCCKNELFVFDDETGLWTSNSNIITQINSRFTDSLYVLKDYERGHAVKTKKSYGNTTHLTRDMLPFLKSISINDNWVQQTQSSSLGKILFNNGYYDFKKGQFYSKVEYGFNPEIIFTGKIHHDFTAFDDDDMEYMDDIQTRLFYDALGEDMGDYLILNLARGLAGDCMKRILFGLGSSNTGNTVLSNAVMMSCGDYVGSFNAENLAYRNSSNDEAQIMRWAMLLKNKRIIFSNEMKSTTDLNGNMIKKISSSGDNLIGRTHGGVEEEFQTHFLPVCFANDIPKIKPYDDAVNNRVRVLSYNKVYVENPSNEFELKMDANIKEEIKTQRFQRVFVGLLIREYELFMQNGEPAEPAEVITSKQEWIGDETNVLNLFSQDFKITNDEGDYIKSCELKEWIESKKLGISMEKFSKEIKKYCSIQKFNKVQNKNKKICGKTLMCWFGIQRIEETNNVKTELTVSQCVVVLSTPTNKENIVLEDEDNIYVEEEYD